MKSAISNWIYRIYGYSIEIQISDIVYYKVCSIWYTKHFILERSLASQNCFVALWHLWIVVLTLSTSQIEEVLQNCLIWENRKHYTKLQWSKRDFIQQNLCKLQFGLRRLGLSNCLWFWSLGCCAILAGKLQLKSIIPLLVGGSLQVKPIYF